MVEHLRLTLCLNIFTLLLANTYHDFSPDLIATVLQQLNSTNSDQFDALTEQLSRNLSAEQQQRLAANVPLLEAPKSGPELRQLQLQLSPNNSFKQYLWISYFWQLRHAQRLHSDNMLLSQFALTLRRLRAKEQQWRSNHKQLQNMLQSLPHYLKDLVRSRWACLKHSQEQLYALPNLSQSFGVSNNCSMWQVEFVETTPDWLRLVNVCDLQSIWYVNMLLATNSNSYMLLSSLSNITSFYCVNKGLTYFMQVDLEGLQEKQEQDRVLSKDCQWQLNDCTHLPEVLSRYFHN